MQKIFSESIIVYIRICMTFLLTSHYYKKFQLNQSLFHRFSFVSILILIQPANNDFFSLASTVSMCFLFLHTNPLKFKSTTHTHPVAVLTLAPLGRRFTCVFNYNGRPLQEGVCEWYKKSWAGDVTGGCMATLFVQ